jgi:hypothetical protein
MSNPYDPGQGSNPYGGGSNPYGAPGGSPYGGGGGYGTPYGQSGAYGDSMPKKNDAVSIIAFVLSLTCCLSLIGAIMGFIGLSRTKGGKRKARWAAIAAIIIGLLGTAVVAVTTVVIVNAANSVVDFDEAKRGDCVDDSLEDDESLVLTTEECDSKHDGEITWVGTFGDVEGVALGAIDPNASEEEQSRAVCTALMDPADVDALGPDVEYVYLYEQDEANDQPQSGDAALCVARAANGGSFDSKQLP